jgi:antitoxin (DNA-binding transcriptional repressor) of toxin-antitoxin stability system
MGRATTQITFGKQTKVLASRRRNETLKSLINRLSALMGGLKGGASVLILDRGLPVARLEPVTRLGEGEEDGRLSRLIREGIVRPARKPLASSLFTSQPPQPKGDASAVATLVANRRDSR